MADRTVHRAYSPRIAVLTSPDVDRIVQKNGVAHFAALLRAFEWSAQNGASAHERWTLTLRSNRAYVAARNTRLPRV